MRVGNNKKLISEGRRKWGEQELDKGWKELQGEEDGMCVTGKVKRAKKEEKWRKENKGGT